MKQGCLIHTGLSEYLRLLLPSREKKIVVKMSLDRILPTRISPGKRERETYAVLPCVVEDAYRIALSYIVPGSKESDQLKFRGGYSE